MKIFLGKNQDVFKSTLKEEAGRRKSYLDYWWKYTPKQERGGECKEELVPTLLLQNALQKGASLSEELIRFSRDQSFPEC